MAYAELAGFPPVVGFYSSILPLIAYACLGSSSQLIVGPDAATCTIVAATLVPLAAGDPERYLALSVTLSLIVGIMCVVAGVLRLGFVGDFLSRPILTGFMNGVALTIISKQLGNFCGFALVEGTGFFLRVANFLTRLGEIHAPTLVVGLVTLVLIWVVGGLAPRFPSPLIGVIAGFLIATVFDLEKSAIALVGSIPAGFPLPKLPSVSLDDIQTLSFNALGILIVSFCSAIVTAKSFATRNGYNVDANRELTALGAANLASATSQGFVVSGADSRTAISDLAGGKTRITGVYTAVLMTMVLLFLTRPLSLVPKSSLAAVLISAGVSLFELGPTLDLYRRSRREFWVANVATLGVITIGVVAGIVIAIMLAVTTLLLRVSRPHDAILGLVPGAEDYSDIAEHPGAQGVPGLLIYRFDAALLFFNAEYFKQRVRAAVAAAPVRPRSFIFDVEAVTMIDITAHRRSRKFGPSLNAEALHLRWPARGPHSASIWNDTVCLRRTPRASIHLFDPRFGPLRSARANSQFYLPPTRLAVISAPSRRRSSIGFHWQGFVAGPLAHRSVVQAEIAVAQLMQHE